MAREKCIISIPPPQTPALCFFPKETHLSLTSHVCFIPVYYTPNQYKSTTWTFSNWRIKRKNVRCGFFISCVVFSLESKAFPCQEDIICCSNYCFSSQNFVFEIIERLLLLHRWLNSRTAFGTFPIFYENKTRSRYSGQ
uniref:Uncharacterized protein n=1 Tax=Cacopsylla melanoneura TaxID=428564 RepID=A0A8D9BLW4_9HEMI